MSNNSMVLFQQAGGAVALSNKFQAMAQAGMGMDLSEGIRSSYGIVSIKGGKFRIKYSGEERILDMPHPQDPTQRLPVSFIDVVIVKANPFLNKQFYHGNYVEGSTDAPDCYSLDGKVPSPAVQQPQHTNCTLCPMNQFGSKIGDDGKKQKACRDTKKLAIVPMADIRNASMGGAMLFRVPPSALKDLDIMSKALKGRGYPYNSVAVRIGFDTTVSHPKPTFQAIRPLTDDEADLVLEMFQSDSVAQVLADTEDAVEVVPQSAQFIQPQAVAAPSSQPVHTHGWTPGQPLPSRPANQVPPVNPNATAPRPQLRPTILNQPAVAAELVPGQHIPAEIPQQPGAVIVQPDEVVEQVLTAPPQPAAANPFAAPPGVAQGQQAKPAAPRTRRAPVTPVTPPVSAAPAPTAAVAAAEPAPANAGQLDAEINNILGGLDEFMGGGK